MSDQNSDKVFAGSVPEVYETHLVPLIFQPYAEDLAARLASRKLTKVLEIAAGTGAVTRVMASRLPASVSITATDLSQPMLDQAAARGTSRPVEWHQADAMALPFEDGTFDAVVCQFGAMFFPDKSKAYAEVRRVLKPGGVFIFNVWGRIDQNDIADVVTSTLAEVFPNDPPGFLARTPYGYNDPEILRQDLAKGGFTSPDIATVTHRSHAKSCEIPAIGYCEGTPLRGEIEARAPSRLEEITDIVAKAIVKQFGSGPVDTKIQAVVVTVEK